MVKGISKQVIVVHSPDKKLFDQAIFILTDDAVAGGSVTDEQLLKEAKRLIRTPASRTKGLGWMACALYTALGAILTGGVWLLSVIL